jgi:uncharacterized membrane protein YphA (DoxX/SURF4 family)
VGLPAIIQGVVFLSETTGAALENWGFGLALAAGGAFLLAGLLTPLASLLVAMLTVAVGADWFSPPHTNLFNAPLPAALVAIVAVALSLLGPGRLSFDCRLFGRREIIIPRVQDSPNL